MAKRVLASFAGGALLMYFADRQRGRRRRAAVRDRLVAGWNDVANELDKARSDISNRSRGVAWGISRIWKSSSAEAQVLEERVRTAVGRAVSHPHAIGARADGNGRIVLEGRVLRHEVDGLLKKIRSVRGVKQVVSRLDVHREPGTISSLQGGVPRRQLSEFARENWNPSLRVAAGALGGAALWAGARNNGPLGWLGAAGGAVLLARTIANRPFRKILGVGPGAGAVHFEKTIHIDAPLEEVYAWWSSFENFPKFMSHLKEVRHLSNGHSHWVAYGPGGISIPWDAEIADQRANELLAWRSVPGSLVQTAGSVRFDRESDGRTRVQIRMSYCPPAGVFGHAVAWLFGADPKSEMDDDLVRMKSLLEYGKTRAHGVDVTRDEVAVGPTSEASGSPSASRSF